MLRLKGKSVLILLALAIGWGLTFWLQHVIVLAPAVQLIGVPGLLLVFLLLAAIALDQSDH